MRHSALTSVLVVNLKSLPTWHLDVVDAFHQLDVAAQAFITTPQTLPERLEKTLRGTKWFESSLVAQRLLETCQTFKPDMILFLGMFVLPQKVLETLQRKLTYKPLLTAWVCDCFREPQFDDWLPADHVFYFDTFMESVLPRYFPDPSCMSFLPLAANVARYQPIDVGALDQRLIFVGNVSPNRGALLHAIENDVAVEVYGPNSLRNRGNKRKKLTSDTINMLYNRHRVVLNINQSPNTEHGANLRTFEAPAAGALLLTEACQDLELHYEPGVEILSYSSPQDLVQQYRATISEPHRAAAIASAGLRRTRAEHTFVHRAQKMLQALA